MESYNVSNWKPVEEGNFTKLCRDFENELSHLLPSKDLEDEIEVKIVIVGLDAIYGYMYLLHSIASGRMLGSTNVILVCFVEKQFMSKMQEMANELKDCARPLLKDIIVTSNENEAFKNIQIAILLSNDDPDNSINNILTHESTFRIFKEYGPLFNLSGSNVKILVASKPTLMNAQILRKYTPTVAPNNIATLCMPLINIVKFQVAQKMNAQTDQIKNVVVWGKDTADLTYDLSRALFKDAGTWKNLEETLANGHWIKNNLPGLVNQRMINFPNEVNFIALAKGICEQMKEWWFGLPDQDKDITRMGVESDGSFGITKGLFVDMPVRISSQGHYQIASDVEVSAANQIKIQSLKDKLLKDIQLVQSLSGFQQLRLV